MLSITTPSDDGINGIAKVSLIFILKIVYGT